MLCNPNSLTTRTIKGSKENLHEHQLNSKWKSKIRSIICKNSCKLFPFLTNPLLIQHHQSTIITKTKTKRQKKKKIMAKCNKQHKFLHLLLFYIVYILYILICECHYIILWDLSTSKKERTLPTFSVQEKHAKNESFRYVSVNRQLLLAELPTA